VIRVGLISDTHGLLRPEALRFLAGSDHIIHAGDIGGARILEQLALIAPVTAVRGNNDKGAWADTLAETQRLQFGKIIVHVLHDVSQLRIDPQGAGVQVVVAGHSHKPAIVEKNGVRYINPGSAGPRRFKLPISIGELQIDGAAVASRLVELACG